MTELFTSIDARAVAVAVTANTACALIGVQLVVRRQSLMGDAISHAVLPGLAIAFLASGGLGPGPMLAGAAGAGLATTFLTETLRRRGAVAADAALGVVYTSLFALGVVLVKRYVKGVHFDVQCVYAGSLLTAALESTTVFGVEAPRALVSAGIVLLLVGATTLVLWKELKLCAFDPGLATTLGFSATAVHYLVMGMAAMTAAVAFEAVGAILVVAMMVTPAATAELLTDRLAPMTLLAMAIAAAGSVVGYGVATALDVSPAGAMATVTGLAYATAALASPRGVVARLLGNMRLAIRVRSDDLLTLLYRNEEQADRTPPVSREAALRSVGEGRWARRGLEGLLRAGLVVEDGMGLGLTENGRSAASRIVRSHRLWEKYLVEEVGVAEDHVHEAAHVVEHYLDQGLDAEIERSLPDATRDPHGRAIPGSE